MQPNGSANQPPSQPPDKSDATQHSVPLPPPVKGLSLRSERKAADKQAAADRKLAKQTQAASQAGIKANATEFPSTVKLMSRWNIKAILTAGAIGLIPVVGLGGLGYSLLNQSIAQTAANQQQVDASQIADRLTQFLTERHHDLQQLADLQAIQDARLTAPEKLRLLEQQKIQSPAYKGLAVLDLNGQVRVQTSGNALENQAQQAYFREVLQSNQAVIGQPQGEKWGTVVPIAVPILDSNNKITGVLLGQISLDKLLAVLGRSETSIQQQVYATDLTGKVLFSTDIGATSATGALGQSIEQRLPNSQNFVTSSIMGQSLTPRLKLGLSLLGLSDKQQPDHVLGLATTGSIKGVTSNLWRTVVAADVDEVLAQQQQRSLQFGLAMVSLLGIVGIAALMMARHTTRFVSDQVFDLESQYRALEERQKRSVERSQWLGQMIETMRQSMGESALLNTTVTELRYALNSDRVMFYRCNDDWSGTIIAESVAPNYRKFLGQTIHDLFREGSVDRYQDGQVQVIPDVSRLGLTRAHRDSLEKLQIKASLIAPIMQHDKLVGLLCAHQCSEPRQWEGEDVDLFAKLSSQLGFVLEQSALIHRQAQSVEKSRILNEIVDSMRRSFKEEDILNTTVNELRYTLDVDRVVVYRLDRDGKALIVAESVGLTYAKIAGKIVSNPFPAGIMERYRMGQVWTMPDIDAEGLPPEYRDLLDEFQVRASVVVPIIQNGELMGLLAVHRCQEPQAWQNEDVALVAGLGSQLGLALNQAAILRRQTLSAERLRTLNEIVSAMRRSLKQSDILATAVNELRIVLNTDRVVIYGLYGQDQDKVIAEAAALSCEKLAGRIIPGLCQDVPVERLKNGHVRAINDIYADKMTIAHQEILEDLQVRASIVAPILKNGELMGLLCAHECKGARAWETQDLDLFAKLAIQLGYALDQAAFLEATEQARQAADQAAAATATEQRQQQEFFQQRAQEFLSQVEPVTRGDLTVQARVSGDEVGSIAKSYNQIISALRQTITDVQVASHSVTTTASSSEQVVQALSHDSKQQIQTVNQALSQIQAMVTAVEKVAERTKQAESNVYLAAQTLQAGDEVMDRTVLGMSSIRETIAETAKKVKRLGEASQKISRAVNLINGFATQTNLLAMNASIEAAKAGEEGQGFAVVAEEVRTLAQQSAAATAEIEQVVEDIQRQTNEVVASMESGTEQVVNGTQLVEESRLHLNQINEVSMQINYLVRDIALSVANQAESSSHVRQTIQQVADMADTTSQQTQNVANSFASLIKVATDLQASTAQFKVRHDNPMNNYRG